MVYRDERGRGEALHTEALKLSRQHQDARCIGWAHLDLGYIARWRGEYDKARTLYDQGLDVARRSRDRLVTAYGLNLMGDLAFVQGDAAQALGVHAQGLRLLRYLEDKPEIAGSLEGIAKAACVLGDHQAAACLHGAAEAIREACNAPVPLIMRDEHEQCVAASRGALAEKAFADAQVSQTHRRRAVG